MRLSEEDMATCREAMIKVAFRLFCERGIESVSLIEIAQQSQVSEATIYRYFENKENLVLEAFLRLWDEIMRSIYKDIENTKDYEKLSGYEQTRVWIDGFGLLYKTHADFILFSYEAKLYLLRHGIRLDKSQQSLLLQIYHAPFLSVLNKGKMDGSIRVSIGSEELFYAILGTVRGYVAKIVIYERLYEAGNPWESRYQIVKEGILSALSSEKNPWKSDNII